MEIIEYLRDYLPAYLGVHPSGGITAVDIFNREKEGVVEYADANFNTLRERAALAMPYQVGNDNLKKREEKLNVCELILAYHRQSVHGEDHSKRIAELLDNTDLTEDERSLIEPGPEGFWN